MIRFFQCLSDIFVQILFRRHNAMGQQHRILNINFTHAVSSAKYRSTLNRPRLDVVLCLGNWMGYAQSKCNSKAGLYHFLVIDRPSLQVKMVQNAFPLIQLGSS